MKQFGRHMILPAVALFLASSFGHAQEPEAEQAAAQEMGCHALMTEKECTDFRSILAALPVGKARDDFLAEHTALIREREGLCNCSRSKADTVIYYPTVQQLALRS